MLKNLQWRHVFLRSQSQLLIMTCILCSITCFWSTHNFSSYPIALIPFFEHTKMCSPILPILSSWVSRNQVLFPVLSVAPSTTSPLSRHFVNIYWRNTWMNNECTLHHRSKSRHSDQKPIKDQSSKKSTNWFLGINRSWLPIFMSNYIGKDFDESYIRGNSH